jgi:hypothetical protein
MFKNGLQDMEESIMLSLMNLVTWTLSSPG